MAETLIFTVLITSQLALLAGILVLFRRTRGPGVLGLSEEEAEAEAYLTNTVERLLQDLEQSADRATAGLAAQRAALEALLLQTPASGPASPPLTDAPSAVAPAAVLGASAPPDGREDLAMRLATELAAPAAMDESRMVAPLQPPREPGAGWVSEALDLARGGLTATEIARRVQRGEAEVRLALTAGELG